MINFKKIGLLEILVSFSAIYVISTLIWTASTRSSVEEKANLIKSNHKQVVEFVNNQINNSILYFKFFMGYIFSILKIG